MEKDNHTYKGHRTRNLYGYQPSTIRSKRRGGGEERERESPVNVAGHVSEIKKGSLYSIFHFSDSIKVFQDDFFLSATFRVVALVAKI